MLLVKRRSLPRGVGPTACGMCSEYSAFNTFWFLLFIIFMELCTRVAHSYRIKFTSSKTFICRTNSMQDPFLFPVYLRLYPSPAQMSQCECSAVQSLRLPSV